MKIEVIDFPSDPNSELGDLRKSLVKALHRASSSSTALELLNKTLIYTNNALKELRKEKKKAKQKQKEQDAKEQGKVQEAK